MIGLLFTGLTSLLSSSGLGVIFGGIMGLLNRKADLAAKRAEYEENARTREHELKQREMDAKVMEAEYAGKMKVAEIEGASRVEAEGYKAMAESYKFGQPQPGTWMDSFAGFIRPFTTMCYLVVSSAGAAYILITAFRISGGQFTVLQWNDMSKDTMDWIKFMASTTIGWWFGMRPSKVSK